MYGYSKDEALGMNVFQIVPHNLAQEHSFLRKRLASGEAVESFETQKIAKDGRIVDVWLTVTALLDSSGQPIAVATTERDITERKRAERALRESEERYRSLVETAGSAIICFSADHKIMEWNREAERISGYSREEALGKDYFELFLPEELWNGVAADINEVVDGKLPAATRIDFGPATAKSEHYCGTSAVCLRARAGPSESLPSDKMLLN